jgi:FemAB-related protein (PEP-CTERM system-associated)
MSGEIMATDPASSARDLASPTDPGPFAVSLAAAGDRDAWDRFVSGRPDAVGYHEYIWREVLQRAFGHESFYLIAKAGDGSIAGVLPIVEIRSLVFGRSFTSLPFLNFGGVLATSDRAAAALLDEAARLAASRGAKHVELRHIGRQFPQLPCRQHKVTMRLPLAAGMWDRIDRKARNQVRKAEKSGLAVTRGGAELIEPFYRVFARNMRDLGTPVYDRRLFIEVARALGDRVRIIVVTLKDAPVAAGFTIRTRGMVEIPWASSIRDYNSMCPNHLLYWHAIETAVADGADTFDFGRSTPGEGTYKFKEQWGADPVALHWEYWLASGGALPDQSPKNPKFRMMIETWKRLPLGLANAVGPWIVRNIP